MADDPKPERAARNRWPWWRQGMRELAWLTDIEDGAGRGAPSQSKMLAWLFAYCICFMDVTVTDVAAMGLVLSASFGRSMFRSWLGRKEMTDA